MAVFLKSKSQCCDLSFARHPLSFLGSSVRLRHFCKKKLPKYFYILLLFPLISLTTRPFTVATNGVMEANGKCGHRPAPKTSVRKKSLPPKINYGSALFTSWDDDDAAKYEGDRWPWCKTSLSPIPPSLSLAWEALIPSACNRHPSPFSRGSGAYGREREGRIGSHGEGEGSLNLKDTHARRIIRIATKITRTILDDVKIDLLLLSNSIWLIRWQSFENPANCYNC